MGCMRTYTQQTQAQLQQQGAQVAPEAAAAAVGSGEGDEEERTPVEEEAEEVRKGNEREMASLVAAIAESRQKAVALKKEVRCMGV